MTKGIRVLRGPLGTRERWFDTAASLTDSRADRVEANALAGMDHRELSGHCENGTLYANARVSLETIGQLVNQPLRQYLRMV
jgi:hypothetical protein